jgi:hypothetical protein
LFIHRNPSISIPIISDKQYEFFQDICSILSVLHHAQEFLSAEKIPTLALALPVYEALIDGLKNCLSESKFPELSHPIKCAVRKLEAYVEKARGLPVYTLAMAINPTLKFSWSDQQGPVQGQEARVMVKDSVSDFSIVNSSTKTDHYNQMYKVRCRLVAPLAVSGKQAPTHVASQAQGRGYARLLTVSKAINRASETTQNLRNRYVYSHSTIALWHGY